MVVLQKASRALVYLPAASTQTQQVSLRSLPQSCQAGLTSLLLGWAVQKETVSDFLHRVGHCDLKCSDSTSEIPPLAMEVLPDSLDNKTYSRLAFCSGYHWCLLLLPVLGPTRCRLALTCPRTCFPPRASLLHYSTPCSSSFASCPHPCCARV